MQVLEGAPLSDAAAKGKYYSALTGVRALAAYMVFFSHANPMDFPGPKDAVQKMLSVFFDTFSVGVSIFFVLSGFLITMRYQQSLQLSWAWLRRYVRNRVARIYPMYFLVTMVTFVASQLSLAYDPSQLWQFYKPIDKAVVLFLNLTFLRGFFDRFRFTLAGQGWSLTVEECFYLSAPFLLLGLRYRPWRLVVYPLMLLGIGFGLVALCAPFHQQLYGLFGTVKFMLNWTFFGRCIEFIMGMALALFMARRPAVTRSRALATTLGTIWIIVCMCSIGYLERDLPVNAANLNNYWSFFVLNLILPIGITTFFWGLLHEKSLVRSILETNLLDLLGKSSYAFYLIHVGVLNFLLNNFVTRNIYIKFLIINIVAIILYKLIEHPVHRILTKRA